MDIYLHESRAGKKCLFEPLYPDTVDMYVCGPTVYNFAHIGNARPPVVFDVLARLLRARYTNVRYASNITDIDDRINAAAKTSGEDISQIAERFATVYRQDIAALGVLPPDIEPRATHHIKQIINLICRLIKNQSAYESRGHVLFHVGSDPRYGQLSKRTLEEMIDGARVEIAPYKRDAKDFVLWKPSSDDLPGWESPWGRGRPGWHIECSAMIRAHLGNTIDIHGGGTDLLFPHHENELAQGTCVDGSEYVRYWVHNGMLTIADFKMSKSIGNVVTIRELLSEHHGEALRYALLSGHYRQSLIWDRRLIEQAEKSLDSLYGAVRQVDPNFEGTSRDYGSLRIDDFPPEVVGPLADDLNTPRAMAALHDLSGKIFQSSSRREQEQFRERLLSGCWLLGILERPTREYFQAGSELTGSQIEQLIASRELHRKNREFDEADAIRQSLLDLGIVLEDSPSGTTWKSVRGSRDN